MTISRLNFRMPLRQHAEKHFPIELKGEIAPVTREISGNAGLHFTGENVQTPRILALIQLHGIVRLLHWYIPEKDRKLFPALR